MEDKQCGKPSLYPGDIVRSKQTGNLLVITEAQTIINGGRVRWNEPPPNAIEHGWPPTYAAEQLPNQKYKGDKIAWWDLEELEIVELGPAHNY